MGCLQTGGTALGFDGIVQLPLTEKTDMTTDSVFLRFALPKGQKLGLRAGEHVYLVLPDSSGIPVLRPFTPVGESDETVDFVIKIYRPNEKFPQGGEMSQLMGKMIVGQVIECRGPYGRLSYIGSSHFRIANQADGRGKAEKKVVSFVNFVCGGTGITPVIPILKAISKEPVECAPRVRVVVANHTPADILCADMLEDCCNHPNIEVYHAISRANHAHQIGVGPSVPVTGRITVDMLSRNLYLPTPQGPTLNLVCGPAKFMTLAYEHLHELGHTSASIREF